MSRFSRQRLCLLGLQPDHPPINSKPPTAGCAPVVRAFDAGTNVSQMWQNASTFASGLRVPKPYGDSIILNILRASDGIALAVSDEEILDSILDWARNEGIFLSPEGASVTAAYDKLLADGTLKTSDRVVMSTLI
ncbi:MAG: pyridoxal-phosphate dependent enzyme [Terracidiphilus sp.]